MNHLNRTSTHKAGPWRYVYENDVGPDDESFAEWFDVQANDDAIARVYDEGDAKAITATPELYDACEWALSYITNPNAIDPHELAAKLVAALVKGGGDKETLEGSTAAVWTP